MQQEQEGGYLPEGWLSVDFLFPSVNYTGWISTEEVKEYLDNFEVMFKEGYEEAKEEYLEYSSDFRRKLREELNLNNSSWVSEEKLNEYIEQFEVMFHKGYEEAKEEFHNRVKEEMKKMRELKVRLQAAIEEGKRVVNSYDWKEKYNESMALFEEMKTQVQTSVKAGLQTALREGREVSSELKRKYNETMSVLGDMRADLQSSVSRELGM